MVVTAARGRRSTSTRSTPGRRADARVLDASGCAGSGRRSSPTRSRRSSPRSPRSRSRSSPRSRSATGSSSASASAVGRGLGVPDARADRRGARGRARRGRLLAPQGRVRGRARARATLDLDALASLPDDEVRARITALRGLGPWTAEWFLARHLARPHAWPAGDLALRKAALSLYGLDVHELGPRLHPFQNLSAHYLLTGSLPPVTIRRATEADEAVLRELWEEFEREVPEPLGRARDVGGGVGRRARRHSRRRRLPRRGRRRRRRRRAHRGARARRGARPARPRRASAARRQGVAKALLRECVARRAEHGRARSSRSTCSRRTTTPRSRLAAARVRDSRRT